jgi:hypothetical protein
MKTLTSLTFAAIAFAATAFGQAADTPFQVSYASNLVAGDSYVDLSNTGASSTVAFPQNGNICVNVYTYDPSEELVSCCACPVTPNGLASLSVKQDLVSNTLTPGVPGSVVIKLLASAGPAPCNASTVGTGGNVLVTGMVAWDTTLTQNTSTGVFESNRVAFTPATLSAAELARATTLCGFIQANGSGFGICRSCRLGALGGSKQ